MRPERFLIFVVLCGAVGLGCTDSADGSMSGDEEGQLEECPLYGMYIRCTVGTEEGRRYCDYVEDELHWGECVLDLDCDRLGDEVGCSTCELVDGEPQFVEIPDCEENGN